MKQLMLAVLMLVFMVQNGVAAEEFETEKMLSDLKHQFNLSREKLEKLKPVLAEKSAELKKTVNESVDKGFAEAEKLSDKLEALSADVEEKVQEVLSSEEMQQLHEYLSSIDREAIKRVNESIVEELSELLDLTAEQLEELRPVLDESFVQLGEMLAELSSRSAQGLDEFKSRYDSWSKELREKLERALNPEQLEILEKHSDELKNTIQNDVFMI